MNKIINITLTRNKYKEWTVVINKEVGAYTVVINNIDDATDFIKREVDKEYIKSL